MAEFPHLSLSIIIDGQYKSPGGGRSKSLQTKDNIKKRSEHAEFLQTRVDQISEYWKNLLEERPEDLPSLPDSIPLLLKIDPNTFDPDSLKGFGIEIISEEEDGYIIGASADIDLLKLKEKIQKFLENRGQYKNKAAQLWDIEKGNHWKVDQILSPELKAKWGSLEDSIEYVIDVAIACYLKIPNAPIRDIKKNESEENYLRRYANWIERKQLFEVERDEKQRVREDELIAFVEGYKGELLSPFVDNEDSFNCRLKLSGKGIKDFVLNYPYVFEVNEYDDFELPLFKEMNGDINENLELLPPIENSPLICVIDSGIQENHKLLSASIKKGSKSYVPNEDTADRVRNGGHGTRVAGAVLYYNSIPINGSFQLPFFIQNAKILNQNNKLIKELYPPKLIEEIIKDFNPLNSSIFNLSINSSVCFRKNHMSTWAASIDKAIYENNINFVISSGNIAESSQAVSNPGIKNLMSLGQVYPNYLLSDSCGIANPAQSAFSLTVGSIGIASIDTVDFKSISKKSQISSFSRVGPGIWGMVKPEVVEYGGDYVIEKNSNPSLLINEGACPELIRSTLHGGNSISKDNIGTSFASPKVCHILGHIQKSLPEETALLHKALLVQSAQWPDEYFNSNDVELLKRCLKFYGYGIPSMEKAMDNHPSRITFISSGNISPKTAHIYEVKIPEILRRPGENHKILIEVTLAYKALPRRTRRTLKSYLSSWLDWHSSKINESHDAFQNRIIKLVEKESSDEIPDTETMHWVINKRTDYGIPGIRLQDSATQKDWIIIPSYKLSESFSLAVVGHKGWEKDIYKQVPYSIVVSFEALDGDIEIYNPIRIENQIRIQV